MSALKITDELFKASRFAACRPIREVFCGKNDTASFQLVLDAGNKRCRVCTGRSPALGREISLPVYRTEVVCPFRAVQRPEGYVADENGVQYADILFDAHTRDYDGSAPPVIWVDVYVPADAKAGDYAVTVNLYVKRGARDEIRAASQTLTLTVYDCAMPSPREYPLYLDLWQHNSNVAGYYGTDLWSDAHFERIEPLVAALADLGQRSVMVLCGDCPWQGWGCYLMRDTPAELYEYSIVSVEKRPDGSFGYDFSALERYIRLCERYGIDGDISVYGLIGIWKMPLFPAKKTDYPENVLIRYLDRTDGCYKYMDTADEIAGYVSALFDFFKDAGLWSKVYVSADEPSDMAAYRKTAELLKTLDKEVKFKLALDHPEVIDEFAGSLACCAASFPCACGKRDALLAFGRNGGRLLYYVCNIPDKPNSVLKSSLCETRFLGALTYALGFGGFLRWAAYCWTVSPADDVRYNNVSLPAGDVCLLYPDKRGGVLKSLRYRALKRGIEDYALLKKAGGETAAALLPLVLKNADFSSYMKDAFHTADGIYSDDGRDYLELRRGLLQALAGRNV